MDILSRYRENHNASSDDESEDSDKEEVWKRAPVKRITCDDENIAKPLTEELKESSEKTKPKRKKNTVWSEVLEDQLISEDLEDCLLKNKPRDFHDRGKESYDYTLGYADHKSERDSDSYMSDSTLTEEPPKKNFKCSQPFRKNVKKFVKLNSTELAAARKINKVLNEKKYYLIQRIVKVVGIEKSMKLLSMTQEIEENGGMMTYNNQRRRTPGGVYIQLLKSDNSVTKEMLDKIFEGEMSGIELKRFHAEKKKYKKKKMLEEKGKMPSFNGSKEIISEVSQQVNEVVPMDAEIVSDMNCEESNLVDVASVPVPKNTSETCSDLEEGEIED